MGVQVQKIEKIELFYSELNVLTTSKNKESFMIVKQLKVTHMHWVTFFQTKKYV